MQWFGKKSTDFRYFESGYMIVSGHDEESHEDHFHRIFNMAVVSLPYIKQDSSESSQAD